nr:hypothetical protein [Marinicella sp. W31]MDC2878290.1 hypothetical protein [Marinicella sp. W31]
MAVGGICFVAGSGFHALFSREIGGLNRFVFDYQTLVSGTLAIFAAVLTVNQMRMSDRQAKERHRELADLQIRPYRLKVERLCQPALQDLLILCGDIDEMGALQVPEAGDEPSVKSNYREWLQTAVWITERFDKLLDRSTWREDSDVMIGWTKYLFREMKNTNRVVSLPRKRNSKMPINPSFMMPRSWEMQRPRNSKQTK